VKIACPIATCRTENDMQVEICISCGTPIRSYIRALVYPDHLFNEGLASAHQGKMTLARDLFASVIHWRPTDKEARHALAMAHLALGNKADAQFQWETILKQFPDDTLARRGLLALKKGKKGSQAVLSKARKVRGKKSAKLTNYAALQLIGQKKIRKQKKRP
jgi:Flp pilus assembly protein TadD